MAFSSEGSMNVGGLFLVNYCLELRRMFDRKREFRFPKY